MKPEVTKGLGSRESALAENVTQANAPVATTAATERFGKFDPVTVDPSVRTDRSAVTRTSSGRCVGGSRRCFAGRITRCVR